MPLGLWLLVAGFVAFETAGRMVATAPAVVEMVPADTVAVRTARVVVVHKQPGEHVAAGDVVVELDPRAIDAEIAVAAAELRASLGEAQVRTLQLEVNLHQEADRASAELLRLAGELEDARAELEAVEVLHARQMGLLDAGLARIGDADELSPRLAVLRRRMADGEASVAAARRREAQARGRLPAHAPAGGPDGGPAGAGSVTGEALKQLLWARDELRVLAPVAGTVKDVPEVGTLAMEGATVLSVIPDRAGRVVAYVGEAAALQTRPGDLVELRPVAGGPARSGRVRAVAPAVTEIPLRFSLTQRPTWARTVWIDVTDEGGLLPGMTFEARFSHARGTP